MDAVDIVTDLNDLVLTMQIRQASIVNSLKYTGYCYYCSEEVKSPFRFCNADCSRDYEEELQIKRRQGLIK